MPGRSTTKFSFNRNDFVQIAISEAAGFLGGYPLVGTAAGLFCRFSVHLINDTFEIRIPALEEGRFDRFLIQSKEYMNSCYRMEGVISRNILYKECHVFDYSNGAPLISIEASHIPFRLQPFDDPEIENLREAGLDGLKETGRFRHDSDTIRLDKYAFSDGVLRLSISKARYSDQARSNLILDLRDERERSIRKQLIEEYGHRLPPLADRRLANTIGVCILVFYKDKGVLTPYFVPRTREVAVFNTGEWHCTASGAAEWPRFPEESGENFEEYILDDLYRELEEEVGLLKADLTNVLPLALCRELVRAGKPQIFFIGFTELSYRELTARLDRARKKAHKRPEPVEVHRMPLFRWPRNVGDPAALISAHESDGFSSEAAASVYYGGRFLSQMEASLKPGGR